MSHDATQQAKKGLADMLVLSVLQARPRHGYDIGQRIAELSGGLVDYHAASLYPVLYRLEARDWIKGRWVEKEGERRRRFYELTAKGRRELAAQTRTWDAFSAAIGKVVRHA